MCPMLLTFVAMYDDFLQKKSGDQNITQRINLPIPVQIPNNRHELIPI